MIEWLSGEEKKKLVVRDYSCPYCRNIFDDPHAKYMHMRLCPQRGVRWN